MKLLYIFEFGKRMNPTRQIEYFVRFNLPVKGFFLDLSIGYRISN